MTTEITLRVPDSVVRKIRAYNILVGGDTKNFEAALVSLMEKTITERIIAEFSSDGPEVDPLRAIRPIATPRPQVKLRAMVDDMDAYHEEDVSGISTGLGDDAPVDEEADEEVAMDDPYLSDSPPAKKKGGGLTDEDLARDMSVNDPEHEAKADSLTFADSMAEGSPEGLFAEVAGLPKPPADQRAAKRGFAKTVGGRRARVKPMTGEED